MWTRISHYSLFVCATGMLLLSSTVARAQVTTADVVGTVTDITAAVMPGAKVTLASQATGQVRTANANSSGAYTFSLIEPGSYSLKVEAPSFQTFSVSSLTIAAGDRARVNAQMRPGQTTSTVEVTAQSPLLQSDSSVLQDVIGQQAVQDLPLNGRNFVQLAQLTMGANEGPPNGLTSGMRPDDRRQSSAISVNGQSDVINDELVDGMDNNERVIGTIGVRPSIEAIGELRVQTNDYTAEVGRTAGGVINVITRAGTNEFHGSAYEYFRNDKLDANAFDFGANIPKTELRQNQYGGSVGGPILKNKTFFFADYEGFRLVQGENPSSRVVPSQAQYNAIHSIAGLTPASILPGGATSVDPVGLNFALLFPAPNVPGQNAYISSPVRTQNSSTADGRIDHHFNENNTLFFRWSYNNVQSFIPDVFPSATAAGISVLPGGTAFGFSGPASDFAQQFQLNYVHIFGPSLLLQLNAGYTRINNFSAPQDLGTLAATKFGMPGVNIDSSTGGLPQLLFLDGTGGLGDSPFVPIKDIDNTFQYGGTVSYTRGTQSMKFGAALIRRQAENAQNNFGEGFFLISSVPDLLAGQVFQESRVNELYPPYWRYWEPSAFFQDDWRATRWLTLNLGLRYDLFTPQVEVHNHQSNFNPYTVSLDVASPSDRTAGVQTYYKNFAPRVGFAASAGKGFVIRGGFGISYFPENYTSNASLKNVPFVFNYGPCGGTSSPCPAPFGTLSAGIPVPSPQPVTNLAAFTGSISDNVIPNFHISYLEQTNFTVQKSFGSNVLTMSYVGMFGRRLAQILNDLNAPPPNTCGAANTACPNAQVLRPFYAQLPVIGQIGDVLTDGSSTYNAFQAAFQRRLTTGFSIDANYTWEHELDDVTGLSNEGQNGYGLVPGQIRKLDWGNSDLDIRSRFALTATYQLPFGENMTGLGSALLKGWSMNALASWETGLPFTVINNGSNVAGTSLSNQSDRPDVAGNPDLPNTSTGEFFNTAAFAVQPNGTLGNEGRNALYGPHFRHVDLSVYKDFHLTESKKIQFRAECFNISNTANFAGLDNTGSAALGNPQFGQLTNLNANYTPREFQFVLKLLF